MKFRKDVYNSSNFVKDILATYFGENKNFILVMIDSKIMQLRKLSTLCLKNIH